MSAPLSILQSLISRLSPKAFTPLLIVGDVLIAIAAVGLAYLVRFEAVVADPFRPYMVPTMLIFGLVVPLCFWFSGLYGYVWRQVGVDMIVRLAGVLAGIAAVAIVVVVALSLSMGYRSVPIGVVVIACVLLFLGAATTRALARLSVYMRTRAGVSGGKLVLLAGAGDAGALLLRDIETQPGLGLTVLGLVDDDASKHGKMLRSARVLGGIDSIPALAATSQISEVLLAMPSAGADARARVLEVCATAGLPVRVMPGLALQAAPLTGVRDLREVRVEDLLGREPAPIDVDQVMETLAGKTVVVTGAAGSIGSELCRQLTLLSPGKIMLIDIDESRLYETYLEINELAPGLADMRICDIRDDRKLIEIFADCHPSVVLHAAAYKHVPLMEIEPDEAVKTNVIGTRNVLEASRLTGVDRFVLISTDKAVAPQSVMGITKAIAERMMIDACRKGLHATAVRFGNVLGSRGSVVPLFEEQLKRSQSLKVTHPDVTRYFMTIPEAARLVLQAQALSECSDIFVLEMGEPVRIVDVAQKMIALSGSHARIEFTGLRPAEKLHEVLINPGESLMPTGAAKITRLSAVPLPPDRLDEFVHGLAVASRLNDRALLKRGFKRILPDCTGCGTNALDYIDEAESAASLSPLDPNMETLL